MFEQYETEVEISKEDIAKIISKIDELSEFILGTSLSDALKNRIIQTLTILRDTIYRVNLIGTEPMLNEIDRMLGQMVQVNLIAVGDEDKTEESQGLFARAVEIAEGVQKIAESGEKLIPLILAGYAIVAPHLALLSGK